jgi:LysM repeat protein
MAISFQFYDSYRRVQYILPLNPSEVTIARQARSLSFSVQEIGTLQIPNGTEPIRVSWSSFFPGQRRYGSVVFPTTDTSGPPENWVRLFRAWMDERRVVDLILVDVPFGTFPVYVESFEYRASGGYGDIQYSISLVEHRSVNIPIDRSYAIATTVSSATPITAPSETDQPQPTDGVVEQLRERGVTDEEMADKTEEELRIMLEEHLANERLILAGSNTTERATEETSYESDEYPSSYIVVRGDTLGIIANSMYGDDRRWREIFEVNRSLLNNNPDLIFPGQVLSIPR